VNTFQILNWASQIRKNTKNEDLQKKKPDKPTQTQQAECIQKQNAATQGRDTK
jgi:hypothetical protein